MTHNFLSNTKNSDNYSWSSKIFFCVTIIIRFLSLKKNNIINNCIIIKVFYIIRIYNLLIYIIKIRG